MSEVIRTSAIRNDPMKETEGFLVPPSGNKGFKEAVQGEDGGKFGEGGDEAESVIWEAEVGTGGDKEVGGDGSKGRGGVGERAEEIGGGLTVGLD